MNSFFSKKAIQARHQGPRVLQRTLRHRAACWVPACSHTACHVRTSYWMSQQMKRVQLGNSHKPPKTPGSQVRAAPTPGTGKQLPTRAGPPESLLGLGVQRPGGGCSWLQRDSHP